MRVPPEIFRQYDVRGTVGDHVTPALATALGQAIARLASDRLGRPPRLAVGRDNRPSGEVLATAMANGVAAAGAVAVHVGMLPTPALYFATEAGGVDGGVQVTGSHNPPEYNGFKMVLDGRAVFGDDIQELRRRIEQDEFRPSTGAIGRDHSVLTRYVDAVVSRHRPLARQFRVVVDCGNGVASLAAVQILEALGLEVVPLFCESDGTFPNHHPDPSVPENLVELQETVRKVGAEVGIAFDGDGDRIGLVDEAGRIVDGDQILILLGRDLVHRLGPGHTVIFDVKCSEVLPQELQRAGLEPLMWKTGHSLIKEKMRETGAPLAGEMSGHMFFGGDYFGYDDALFAAARVAAFLAREGGPLSRHLTDLPKTVTTPELRVACPDERKFAVVGLLRASNTQPVLVLRFEARDEAALRAARAEVEDWLTEQGVG
jgi:phosphomannomutase/phosphoglucomutase